MVLYVAVVQVVLAARLPFVLAGFAAFLIFVRFDQSLYFGFVFLVERVAGLGLVR